MTDPFDLLPESTQRRISRAASARRERGELIQEFMDQFSLAGAGVAWTLLTMQAMNGGIPDDDAFILEQLHEGSPRDDRETLEQLWGDEIRPKLEPHPGRPGFLRFVVPTLVVDFSVFAVWCAMDDEERLRMAERLREDLDDRES